MKKILNWIYNQLVHSIVSGLFLACAFLLLDWSFQKFIGVLFLAIAFKDSNDFYAYYDSDDDDIEY